MGTYRVEWTNKTVTWATVEADSEEEAIEKAQAGDHNNDIDSEPGGTIKKSYKAFEV